MSEATSQLKDKGAEALVKMIDVTVQSMNDVIDFSKQQIPDIIHQLLLWKATESFIWGTLGLIILIITFFLIKKIN